VAVGAVVVAVVAGEEGAQEKGIATVVFVSAFVTEEEFPLPTPTLIQTLFQNPESGWEKAAEVVEVEERSLLRQEKEDVPWAEHLLQFLRVEDPLQFLRVEDVPLVEHPPQFPQVEDPPQSPQELEEAAAWAVAKEKGLVPVQAPESEWEEVK